MDAPELANRAAIWPTDIELGKIMVSTFNPGTDQGWRLSNGGTTASSPNNNVMSSINAVYDSNAIPDDAETCYEFTVSGAAVQTAFSVGFGESGSDLSNSDLTAEGKTITNSTFVERDLQRHYHQRRQHHLRPARQCR